MFLILQNYKLLFTVHPDGAVSLAEQVSFNQYPNYCQYFFQIQLTDTPIFAIFGKVSVNSQMSVNWAPHCMFI